MRQRLRASSKTDESTRPGALIVADQCVPQSTPPGKRDFAMLLLMTAYGLGAAEVLGLRLEDVDWQAGILKACRPKTKVCIELPVVPSVARALAAYLRWGTSASERHYQGVLEQENAVFANHELGDSISDPPLCSACRCCGESDRGACISTQPCQQANRWRGKPQSG